MNAIQEIIDRCRQRSEDEPQYYVDQCVDAYMDVWTTDQIMAFLKEHDDIKPRDVELNHLDSLWRSARHREDFIDTFHKILAMTIMNDLVGYRLRHVRP
jgi:hypothetical protein